MATPILFLDDCCPRSTHTRPGRTKLEIDVDAAGVPLVGIRGRQYYSSYTAIMIPLGGLFLGGLGPPVSSSDVVVDPPALAPADFDDFHRHGPP